MKKSRFNTEVLLSKLKKELKQTVESRKKRSILIFSDLSGSTPLSRRSLTKYFQTFLDHLLCAHLKLVDPSKERKIVKIIGDEVMLTQIVPTGTKDTEIALKSVVIASVSFQQLLEELGTLPAKVGIHLCNEIIPSDLIRKEIGKEISENFGEIGIPDHVGDILGPDVALAARIMNVAEEKHILLSGAAFDNLPKAWKSAAKKKKKPLIVNMGGKDVPINFDMPMEFRFKGFEDALQEVIQVTYDDQTEANPLSKTAYKYKCLTLFQTIDPPMECKNDLIKLIETVFPKRSPLFYFIYNGRKTHPSELSLSHLFAVLFQCQDYETYRSVLSTDFLDTPETKRFIQSIITVPIVFPDSHKNNHEHDDSRWDRWEIANGGKKSGLLCLWRLENWATSREFPRILANGLQLCLLNLIVAGSYDNMSFHVCEQKEVDRFLREKQKILRRFEEGLHQWPCLLIKNKSLEKW